MWKHSLCKKNYWFCHSFSFDKSVIYEIPIKNLSKSIQRAEGKGKEKIQVIFVHQVFLINQRQGKWKCKKQLCR